MTSPPHRQIEPFASTAPYVTAVGNHEHVPGNVSFPGGKGAPEWHAEFAAYSARYGVGGGGPGSAFWYSVEAGPLHLCVISSEHAYARGSPQWEWLAGDLAAVDRGVTPWLAVMLHRPVLSAAVLEWDNHCPGCPLSAALEPLFRNASVDVVIAGHIHRCARVCASKGAPQAHPLCCVTCSYEYTHAVYNGTVVTRPSPGTTTYVDPQAPIYVVQVRLKGGGCGGGEVEEAPIYVVQVRALRCP